MMPMTIVFRGETHYESVDVDADGIQFVNNEAYFSDMDGNDYIVKTEHIVTIAISNVEYR